MAFVVACFHPLSAWQLEDKSVVFAERGNVLRSLVLPCGQCIGCRLDRSRMWAVRCLHESQLHPVNCFITLTYNDFNLPTHGSLNHRHFQLFMKRLRKSTASKIRYYMCGEYGDDLSRPHYHACLFNCFFNDRVLHARLPSGSSIYRSSTLEALWPHGFSSIGDVTFESAAYVARYVMKKVTGPSSEDHYSRFDPYTGEIFQVQPEYTHMSLKPGIGADWFRRFRTDTFNYDHDYVVVRGVKMRPPKYYYNLLKSDSDFMSDYIEFLRSEKSQELSRDFTPERLAAREAVTISRLSFLKRTL